MGGGGKTGDWGAGRGGLGGGSVVGMLFFCSRWCSSSQAVVGSEMARFRGTWGQHGGWDKVWGRSVGSGSAFRRSPAASHGPKWGRAG